MSAIIGWAVRAHMGSARASPIIGTSASASDSATDYGSDAGLSPGGGRTDGDGATTMTMAITITITSASITSTSITIGITALFLTSMVMVTITGMEESGPLTGARILIHIPVAVLCTRNR